MERRTYEVFEAGVDWITVSAFAGNSAFRLETRARRLLREQVRCGEEEKPWAMSGYTGMMAGGVQFGMRGEDVLCRLTSETAFEHWTTVYAVADNCSRLDLQVTVRVAGEVQPTIHKHYKEAMVHSRSMKRGPKVSVFSSSDDATTLYLGDRTSDKFGRCYNKQKESKLDYYKSALRYEVEFKDDAANLVAKRLSAETDHAGAIAGLVHAFFSGRGCRLKWSAVATERLCRPRSRPSISRRLAWLGTNVRGTVVWLCERGLDHEVLSAIGMEAWSGEVRLKTKHTTPKGE